MFNWLKYFTLFLIVGFEDDDKGESEDTSDDNSEDSEDTNEGDDDTSDDESDDEDTSEDTSEGDDAGNSKDKKDQVFFNPKDVPESLRPTFRKMQARYTQKMQGISELKRRADAFHAITTHKLFPQFV